MPTPLTSIIIEEIIESPMDLGVPALKKEQTLSAIKGFAPLILSLLGITEPTPRFVQKGTLCCPCYSRFRSSSSSKTYPRNLWGF